jgi:hypothetical protein
MYGKEKVAKPARTAKPAASSPPPKKSAKDIVANVPPEKRKTLAAVLKQKVTNPKTKKTILVATALKYDKQEPVYKLANIMVKKALSK